LVELLLESQNLRSAKIFFDSDIDSLNLINQLLLEILLLSKMLKLKKNS